MAIQHFKSFKKGGKQKTPLKIFDILLSCVCIRTLYFVQAIIHSMSYSYDTVDAPIQTIQHDYIPHFTKVCLKEAKRNTNICTNVYVIHAFINIVLNKTILTQSKANP